MGKWQEKVKDEKRKILDWKTTDRLSLLAKITFMNASLSASVEGWSAWLRNPIIMEEFSEKELENLAKVFLDLTSTFLDLDLFYTELLEKKRNARGKSKKKKKTIKKEKIPYMV